MEFWFTVGAVIAVIIAIPFVRFFIKRILLFLKLKKVCKNNGAVIIPAKKLWIFGLRSGKRCDFHIETEKELLSVKLFQMLRRSSTLHLTDENKFYCEHCIITVFGRYGGSNAITYKTKPRRIPDYDFSSKLPKIEKPQRKLLLVNPICSSTFIHAKGIRNGKTADVGEEIGKAELYALKALINLISNEY